MTKRGQAKILDFGPAKVSLKHESGAPRLSSQRSINHKPFAKGSPPTTGKRSGRSLCMDIFLIIAVPIS